MRSAASHHDDGAVILIWHIASWFRSLLVQLLGTSLLLLLIVQIAGFAVVRNTIQHNARSQLAHTLDADEKVWQRLLEQHAERLRQGVILLSADDSFRAAVGAGDQATIQSALQSHSQRMGDRKSVV